MKKIKSSTLSDVPGRSPRINHCTERRGFLLRSQKGELLWRESQN